MLRCNIVFKLELRANGFINVAFQWGVKPNGIRERQAGWRRHQCVLSQSPHMSAWSKPHLLLSTERERERVCVECVFRLHCHKRSSRWSEQLLHRCCLFPSVSALFFFTNLRLQAIISFKRRKRSWWRVILVNCRLTLNWRWVEGISCNAAR